ncbi:SDR family NAD(P)-dependent oxidoreductase [Acinetobacter rudis]|uniref:Short-chain dehydrogenase n=1 Tax=Acinetobacter rudis CIP 110305 TaxID=421052 RepID=S3MX70_9GAMM|nr:SDR family NAD(P)-dependent oxidoreductase [Acinetobacter rudis]EPF71018.1 hypothetical protein F945_02781 [Acinetobacter rudis CIP 110305]
MKPSEPQITTQTQVVVVFGVGAEQGIGAAVCRRFAQAQYKLYVVGRSVKKVQRVANTINHHGGRAVAHVVDAEDSVQVQALFDQISQQQEYLAAVIHNVGGNIPSIFLQTRSDFFNQMWRSTFLSAFVVAQSSLKIFQKQQSGTLLFTGASASMRAKPFFAAFSMGKFALRNYALNLAQYYRSAQIHVAHIVIDGMVDGDRVNRALWGLGRIARLTRGTGGLNIDAIAESYWMLHQQTAELWTHELDLRPYQEKF